MKKSPFLSTLAILLMIPLVLYTQSRIKTGGAATPTVYGEYWGGVDQNGIARPMIGMSGTQVSIDPDALGTTYGGAQAFNGNMTIGDSSADTVTVNSSAWTFANDTTVALTGGVNGLNIDSNTMSVDATNNRVGFNTAAPDSGVHVATGFSLSQGTEAASANDLDLAETTGNIFGITGTTQLNQINTTGWTNGSTIGLLFSDALTIAHNQTPTGLTARFVMDSNGNMTTRANSLIFFSLTTSGSVRAWRPVGVGNN